MEVFCEPQQWKISDWVCTAGIPCSQAADSREPCLLKCNGACDWASNYEKVSVCVWIGRKTAYAESADWVESALSSRYCSQKAPNLNIQHYLIIRWRLKPDNLWHGSGNNARFAVLCLELCTHTHTHFHAGWKYFRGRRHQNQRTRCLRDDDESLFSSSPGKCSSAVFLGVRVILMDVTFLLGPWAYMLLQQLFRWSCYSSFLQKYWMAFTLM